VIPTFLDRVNFYNSLGLSFEDKDKENQVKNDNYKIIEAK